MHYNAYFILRCNVFECAASIPLVLSRALELVMHVPA